MWILALALASLLAPAGGAAGTPDLEAELGRLVAEHRIPGAVVALIRRGQPPWLRAFGERDRDRHLAMEPSTLLRVGSISKSFTAAALMTLVAEGRLDLQARVLALAPELGLVNPWERDHPLRVVHLLEHTSGLPDYHFPELFDRGGLEDPPLSRQLAVDPAWLRLRWPPGERWAYSNRAFAVVAHLIEVVTGEPWRQAVRRRVLEPAGLAGAGYVRTPARAARLAQGYLDARGPPAPYLPAFFRPAANLMASGEDLARWVSWLLRDAPGALPPGTVRAMARPRASRAAREGLPGGWGIGLVTRGNRDRPSVGHYGGGYAYQVAYGLLPREGLGWVVGVNSSAHRGGFDALQEAVYRALTEGSPPPAPPPVSALDPGVAAGLVGYYRPDNPRHEVLALLDGLFGGGQLRQQGGQLWLERFDPTRLASTRRRLLPAGRLAGPGRGLALRLEDECLPGLVLLEEPDGGRVLVGDTLHARRCAWPWPRLLGGLLLLSLALVGLALLATLGALGGLATGLLATPLRAGEAPTLAATLVVASALGTALGTPPHRLGLATPGALWVCWAGYLYPALVGAGWVGLGSRTRGTRRDQLVTLLLLAHGVLVASFAWGGWLGLRLWAD